MNTIQISVSIGIFIITVTILTYFVFLKKEELKDFSLKDRFVLYYTPWCGHCATLKPDWIVFQKENALTDLEIEMVDCDTAKEVCNKLQIETIPAIILHKKNEKIIYEGEMEISKIQEWLISKEYK